MQTIKLDSQNNLILEQNGIKIIEAIEACAQDTTTRLGLIKGENPFNISEGIDYFNEILGKMGTIKYYEDLLKNRILENEEIIEVLNVAIVNEDKILKVKTDIRTIYGRVEQN